MHSSKCTVVNNKAALALQLKRLFILYALVAPAGKLKYQTLSGGGSAMRRDNGSVGLSSKVASIAPAQ